MMINRVRTVLKISSIVSLSLAMLASAKLASAQQPPADTIAAFPPPNFADMGQNTGGGLPACAASANRTGHLICVYGDSNNNLYAVSAQTESGGFPGPDGFQALDPAPTTNIPNPLYLGVAGTLGISSCASTADNTGDVVCGYRAPGAPGTLLQLMGIRFNIFKGSSSISTQNLGIMIAGYPACTNGSQRFTATGMSPMTKTLANDTICVVRNSSNRLVGIAFNPASTDMQTVTTNATATIDFTCTNSNTPVFIPNASPPAAEQVICVYNGLSSMRSIVFTTFPTLTAGTEFNPYPAIAWQLFDVPGCSAPNDGTGDVFCLVALENGTLAGFALNPVTGYKSPIWPFFAASVFTNQIKLGGVPSCSGLADGSSQIMCSFIAFQCLTSACFANGSFVGGAMWSDAIKFDGRTGLVTEVLQGPEVLKDLWNAIRSASCTFQNVNLAQISCGVAAPDGRLLGEVFK